MTHDCPDCLLKFAKPDDAAIHLVDEHHWDFEMARVWLKMRVEERAFHDKP